MSINTQILMNPFVVFAVAITDLEAYLLEDGSGHYLLEALDVYLLESAAAGTGGMALGGYQGNGTSSGSRFGHFAWVVTSGTESDNQSVVPIATTYQGIHCNVNANSADASTFRFRVDGSNGNQAATITASTTGVFSDTSNSDTVSQAQKVGFMFDYGTTGSITIKAASVEDTGNATQCGGYQANSAISSDSFVDFTDVINNPTEAQQQAPAPANMTYANAHCNVTVNSRSSATQFRIRIAGSNGNTNATITASTTGIFADTSNSDAVNQGDLVNYMFDVATGSGSVTVRGAGLERSV